MYDRLLAAVDHSEVSDRVIAAAKDEDIDLLENYSALTPAARITGAHFSV